MGLGIIAFEKAKMISADFSANVKDLEYEGEGEAFRVKINPHFSSHDHLTDGIYVCEGRMIEFNSGSYGTYGGFRRDLCLLAHGVEPKIVWENPEMYETGDFYGLINFSDCEGAIGPTTAGKLYWDFKRHREAYLLQSNEWDAEIYDYWMKAMEYASNDGLLIFC